LSLTRPAHTLMKIKVCAGFYKPRLYRARITSLFLI
jgi:hypothetical protein